MIHEQPDLDFTARPASPEIGEVEILLNYLSNNPGFHTARQLAGSLGLSDRHVRHLAALSDGLIVSGPGSNGYCHLYHCPAETITHIADTLESQARAMQHRAIRIRIRAHKLLR